MKSLFLVAVLYLINFPVNAGNIDLSIAVSHEANINVEYGQIINFSLTISNLGKDDAGIDDSDQFPINVISSVLLDNGNGIPEIQISAQNIIQDCFFVPIFGSALPGAVASYAFSINYPVIPANTYVTCHGMYKVNFKAGVRNIIFRVTSNTDTEIFPSDNLIELSFTIQPKIIPVLNFYSVLLLLILMIVLVYFKSKSLFKAIW